MLKVRPPLGIRVRLSATCCPMNGRASRVHGGPRNTSRAYGATPLPTGSRRFGDPNVRQLEPPERVAAADRAPSTSSVSARIAPFPCFAPVEDPEHQNGAAIVRVMEGVRAPEGLEQEFAVFLVASYVNDRDLADPEDGFVIVQAE